MVLESSELDARLLPPGGGDPADGDDLHGGLLQGVPAVVPRHPGDAVVK